jgi:hypothetical protein
MQLKILTNGALIGIRNRLCGVKVHCSIQLNYKGILLLAGDAGFEPAIYESKSHALNLARRIPSNLGNA